MGSRPLAVLARFGALVLACLLASAAVTFAADQASTPTAATTASPAPAPAPEHLVVPDVRGQVYVFAKGALEDAGFAWKVDGPVEGYAANTVVTQSPAAGTKLVDTGAPLVRLTLAKSPKYPQKGAPENESPHAGTAVRLAGEAGEPTDEPMSPGPEDEAPAAAPAAVSAAAAKPTAAAAQAPAAAKLKAPAKAPPARARTPAFRVPGAPAEPRDEISLPQRAKALRAWVRTHPKPTNANVRHWLYQHEWIVTGARFGWSGGVAALEVLVATDREVEALWGVGTKSRLVAAAALEDVRAKTR